MGDRYIANVAKTLIGSLGIRWTEAIESHFGDVDLNAQHLYARRAEDVLQEVRKMRPETLGKIAVHGLSKDDPRTDSQPRPSGITDKGKTSLYAVHCGAYLGKHDSGRAILLELVVTAIIAEMTDILREKMECENSRQSITSEGM